MRKDLWPAWVRFIPLAALAAALLAVLYSGPLQKHLRTLSSQGKPENAGANQQQFNIAAPSGLAAELLQWTGVFLAQEPSQTRLGETVPSTIGGPVDGTGASGMPEEFQASSPATDLAHPSLTSGPELLPGSLLNLFQTRDCCAATAPWALGNNILQGAIMCPDAAKAFLEQNPDFILLGPALVNSDVFMSLPPDKRKFQNQDEDRLNDNRSDMRNDIESDSRPQKVGVAHKRAHQARMAKLQFSQTAELYPMIPQALPFALHDGVVDSIIIDLGVASGLGGNIAPWTGEEMVTQVLVVSRAFADSPDFAPFAQAYEKARALTEQKYKGRGVTFPALEAKANSIQGKYTQ